MKDESTPVAVRWCPRCRVRRPATDEWSTVGGLFVCGACASLPAERYNFLEPEPIGDVDVLVVPQRVRRRRADTLTPKAELKRDFGRGMDLPPKAKRSRKAT